MKAIFTLALLGLIACSPGSQTPPGDTANDAPAFLPVAAGATPLKHIVIIVQENRTIDNLFQGYPGADTQSYGYTSTGERVDLAQVSLNSPDIDNSWNASVQSYDNGKMDGFDKNNFYTSSSDKEPPTYPYSYVQRSDVEPYWKMAEEFALADHMFPTAQGESWAAHLDLIASTTNFSPTKAYVDFPSQSPWDCSAPPGTTTPWLEAGTSGATYHWGGPYPCFEHLNTLAATLDAAKISWRYYAPSIKGDWIGGAWSAYSSIKYVREGPDWRKIVTPPPTILTDVAAGKLAAVTWVTPDWQYSDHAGSGTTLGPSWVAAVVNTIGKSQFWDSTAIVVLWDDWGGWFDHVPPPQLDFKGLGIRVPCLIISPYVHRGYVDHTQYEFGSVLRFVEDVYGLPRLGSVHDGYSDARATSLIQAFDFTRRARPFYAIPAPVFSSDFLHMKPSGVPPDN